MKHRLISLGLETGNTLKAIAMCILSILFAPPAFSAEKTFVITTEEWPPFLASALPNDGWAMEVARAALESEDYEVSLRLVPWARAVECAKSGECDGLYLSYYVESRKEWFVFSDPIGDLKTGFFGLKSNNIRFDSLKELAEYRIGMTRGAAVSEAFDEADYLMKFPVADHSLNIKKLLLGRIDLVVAAKPVFEYLIKTSLPEYQQGEFEFIEPALSSQSLHMAISKQSEDYMQKLQDFNAGLARIKADGTYDRIREEYGY